jgi:hypothetical protein
VNFQGHQITFESRVSLGDIVQFIVMLVLLVVGWVKISDRMDSMEKWRDLHEKVFQEQVDIIRQEQLISERQIVIVDGMERRITNLEKERRR